MINTYALLFCIEVGTAGVRIRDMVGDELEILAYTVADAAKAVGMSGEYLRREIKAGRLGCRYAGRSVLIPKDELKAWLDALPSERAQDLREFRVVDLG